MTAPIERIVDAHVHLWDPARTDWYPYLAGQQELDMGDISGMVRRFDVPTYLAESADWNVEKLVNVAAATVAALDRRDPRARREAEATGTRTRSSAASCRPSRSPTRSDSSTSR